MTRKGKHLRRKNTRKPTAFVYILLAAVAVLGVFAAFKLAGTGIGRNAETDKAALEETDAAASQKSETKPEPDAGQESGAEQNRPDGHTETKTETETGPEPEPEQTAQVGSGRAEELLEGMTAREKICQLFIVFPSQITGVSRVTAAGETTKNALEKYPVGGMLYDRSNMVSQEQVRTMLENTQNYSKIPLILTCDEEGGSVNRLMSAVGTTYIGPMLSYREQGTEKAEQNAETIAADMVSCGFNTDLAPVADVWSNEANTVIGDRAYSTEYAEAAELVAAAVEGFHRGGVACTLKHFPGHGDTSADSHYGSVYVYKSLDELRAEELVPFQAGINAGADAVMMGHLIIKDISDEPALFSYRLVTELLRGELGFDGVVMTDSLQMQAMTDHYSSGEIAVKAIKAGVDVLLCPADLDAAVNALMNALENGELTQERIDESVLRVLRLKEARGIL